MSSEVSDAELNDKVFQFVDTESVDNDAERHDNTHDDDDKQKLLDKLTKPKHHKPKRSRYYDAFLNNSNAINVSVSESEEHSDIDTSDSESDHKSQIPIDTLSSLSTLEFEKLVSRATAHLALAFEQNDDTTYDMNDEISLHTNTELNMKELVSFIPDDEDINHDNDHISNTVMEEEMRLADNTMEQSIMRRTNIERKNYAPPLSSLDTRIKRRKRGDNAGKLWFNMKAGRLTPQNKLHFLMLKYRHMLYRKYKPTKVKEDFVPKYFEIGTIIEGPTEFYSSRLTKRERRSSWAKQYLSDPSTKEWLETKTLRAQRRIRRPRNKFWAPIKKLNVNNRYKLRKKIIKRRKNNSRA